MQHKKYVEADPSIMALQFYASLHFLLTIYDLDETKEVEVLKQIKQHVKQFNAVYLVNTIEKEKLE